MTARVTVVGGGLAGCEAAWQLARRGVEVDLHEMRPVRTTPVHQSGDLAELVCSNSLRGNALDQAPGDGLGPYDLCVVGSGPAGATVVAELAGTGLRPLEPVPDDMR